MQFLFSYFVIFNIELDINKIYRLQTISSSF